MTRRSHLVVAACLLAIAGCTSTTSGTTAPAPLTAAQVQQDVANAVYLMQAAGCVIASAGDAAAPIISVAANEAGQQVLQAISASGAVACRLTVPATALPVPAPANAPAATVPAATATPAAAS